MHKLTEERQGITVRRVRRNPDLFAYVLSLYEDFYHRAVRTSDLYERLEQATVIRTEQRVCDLYHEVDSSQVETMLTEVGSSW